MELELATRICGDFVVVTACGEVDAATSGQLGSFLAEARERDKRGVIVDLSRVSFMDCSGLRVLMSAQCDAVLLGGELRLATPQPGVSKVLALSEAYRLLPPFPTVDAAMTAPTAAHIVSNTVPTG